MKSKVKDSAMLRNSGKKHNKMQVEAVKVALQRDVVEKKDAKKEVSQSKENGEVEDIDVKSQTQSNEIDDLDEQSFQEVQVHQINQPYRRVQPGPAAGSGS